MKKSVIIDSRKAEEQAVLNLAYGVCAALRTAPKACGIDHLETAALTGEMRRIGESLAEEGGFFIRDAGNVDVSSAVVIAGAKYEARDLGKKCSLCKKQTRHAILQCSSHKEDRRCVLFV